MAEPATTHVIEIEPGIGEPAFIPLSMGNELQPISVGKKGMWRLESPRVLDVHAFVYFDGASLFLQSADEQNAASVDGFRVGKAWTELHAPCMIEVGMARLRYRSLLADADNQPTQMHHAPPVQAPPGGPGNGGPGPGGVSGSRPGAGAPPPPSPGQHNRLPTGPQPQQPQSQAPRMGTGQRPMAQGQATQQLGSSPPIAFPKAERPFKPGEFAAPPDVDESTRIAPLESTGAGRVASGSHPRPAAGQGAATDDPSTRPEAARVVRGATGAVAAVPSGGSGQFGAMNMQGAPQGQMMQPMQGAPPPGMQGFDPNQQQQGYGPPQQQGYGQQPSYSAGGSGSFGSMGPGGMPQIPGPPGVPQSMGPSMPPGGYGSMTPQGGMQQPNGPQSPTQDFVAKLKANSIPKIIAGVLFIIGGILYLAEDDEPQPQPKRKNVATLDGGAGEAGTAAGTGTGAAPTAPPVMQPPPPNSWPAGVPCPPPNWPPNTPLPCTPNNVTNPTDTTPPPGKKDGGAKDPKEPKEPKDAGAPALPAGTKTLERQAVDFVAAGETAKAAAAYEELVRRDPNNKVYAEAARILRAKLDGGVPGQ